VISHRPVKLIDEPGLVLFYGQDTDFERPRVSYRMRVRQPVARSDLESTVLRGLYVDVVNEVINEKAYTASKAGLAAGVNNSCKGVGISVSGYNQSANDFLDYVTAEMRSFNLAADQFEALKELKVRQLENASFADAWTQGRQTTRKLLYETYYTPAEQLAFTKTVTYKQIQRFVKELFRKGNLEMIAFGNVSQSEAQTAARRVSTNFNLRPIKNKDLFEIRLLELTAKEPVITTETLEVNNSAFL
jgi:insulysin